MLRVKSLLLLLVLLVAAACSEQKAPQSAAAPAGDSEENRQAAAKQYLEVAPPQELLTEMSAKVVKMLPEKSQKVFLEVMQSKSLQESTYNITLKALVKHFTVNELHAMSAYYGSPEGKSIRKKYGDYMADVMPEVNKEVIAALQKVQPEPEAAPEPQGQVKPAEPKAPQAQTKPAKPAKPAKPPAKPAPPSAQ
jgi:hypothetical protein